MTPRPRRLQGQCDPRGGKPTLVRRAGARSRALGVSLIACAAWRSTSPAGGSTAPTTTCPTSTAGGRCYLAVALLLGFLSSWFAVAWGGAVSPLPLVWVAVNVTLPLLAAETADALWREPGAA